MHVQLNYFSLSRMVRWICFGFMLVPEVLARSEEALHMLRKAMGDGFALQLFRNNSINVHTAFEQVFQACDTDNSRTLERDEFQRFFHEMKAHPHRRNSADSRAFLDELSKTPRGELRRALKLR